jgi:hypothetical protein
MQLIDLHTHTTISDGSYSPKEVVMAANKAGLAAVAITDHDNINGIQEAVNTGEELPIEVVPGVEISVDAGFKGGMHMLGFYVDPHEPNLVAALQRLQEARAERNPKIVQRLNELGLDITMGEVQARAGEGQIGRPHFAQVIIEKGYAKNRAEVFNRWLAADKPAYVPKFKYKPAQAISILRGAGGVPVLAHPGLLKLAFLRLESLIRELMEMGLEGVEAIYSEHDQALRKRLSDLASRLGLVITGGSDFHGDPKPDIKLGYGLGDLRVPKSLLNPLRQRAHKVAENHFGRQKVTDVKISS